MTLRELSQTRWLPSSLLIAGVSLFASRAKRNTADTHSESSTETPNSHETTHSEEASAGDENPHTADASATEQTSHRDSPSETINVRRHLTHFADNC